MLGRAFVHPGAIVSGAVVLGNDVYVGPGCILDGYVEIGDGTVLERDVIVSGEAYIGEGNRIKAGVKIGISPEYRRPSGATAGEGSVVIGNGNEIWEDVVVEKADGTGCATHIGDNCMVLAGAHIAHNNDIGSNVVIVAGAKLAGFVTVGDRVYIGGMSGVHQFVRIGPYAAVGGKAKVVMDVPPFALVDGVPAAIAGPNVVGMKRFGMDAEGRAFVKKVLKMLVDRGKPLRDIVAELEGVNGKLRWVADIFLGFFVGSRRGVMRGRG